MSKLTPKQAEVLSFIVKKVEAGLGAPTCREICDHFDFKSPKAATDHLTALQSKGAIARDPGHARGIRLLNRSRGIPILGRIPAGFPVDAPAEDGSERFELSVEALGVRHREKAFAIVVKGDSMEGRQIFDGDIVVVDPEGSPKDGSVVAALIDNEITLKTFVRRDGKVWLRAENPRYPDLIPGWDLQIQGVVRAVVRRFLK